MEKLGNGRHINGNTKLCCFTITASLWGLVLYSYSVALRSTSTNIDHAALTTSSWSTTTPMINNNLTSISCSYIIQAKKPNYPFIRALRTSDNKTDPCGGRYIYVHNLPSRFNEDMIKQCKNLNPWTDMCKFISNAGMGPLLNESTGSTVFSNTGWYATNQFALDLIFYRRMNQYQCLTNNSSLAAAVFVPFFAGFDIARHLWGHNISVRDSASFDLVKWLNHTPEWKIMDGKDHFMVAGRTTWDMRRLTDEDTNWGNKLLRLQAIRNMTTLVIESSPWHNNDYAIPYPTYFHPQKDDDLFNWQERMRRMKREFLFSFAGAPRPGDSNSIRNHIINQCRRTTTNSNSCKLLECSVEDQSKCHSPTSVMNMFQTSHFCLQPQGDSYTRRSAFDSMLAGCIPVFFHPGSAYVQYTWHLPKNFTAYSVFIPEDEIRKENVTSIEDRLKRIPKEQVKVMRENVINLIPNLVYADPTSKLETLKDAFDVAVQGVIDKVTSLRWDIINGVPLQHHTDDAWKYGLSEKGIGLHEWDSYFTRPEEERRGDST